MAHELLHLAGHISQAYVGSGFGAGGGGGGGGVEKCE